jgi:phosphatidylglycerophosphate synthase
MPATTIARAHPPPPPTHTHTPQATDWLDGHLARRLGHTSKLGSYLDPLADKLFVGAAVGSMGWLGMLPGWLAALVVGRDGAQIAGMFVVRLRMFGGTWPGARAFFDVDHDVGAPAAAEAHEVQHRRSGDMEQQQGSAASSSSRTSSGGGPAAAAPAAAPGGLPVIRPLLVSKANTALTMLLVCACMGHQWQGVPSQEVLVTLELLAASTTAASAAAYAWLHARGQLLVTPDAAEQA